MKAHIVERVCKLCGTKNAFGQTMIISNPKKFMEYTGAAFEPKDTKPWLCRECARRFKRSVDLERKKIIAKVFYNM